jgi:putative phosphoesterase
LKKIGLISDTHGYLDEQVITHFKTCDEIWHAGDFGSMEWVNQLKSKLEGVNNHATIRGVYGNIDGQDIRTYFPENLFFTCEGVNVFMKHIGGYPGRYAPGVKDLIIINNIQLFISGHSHILKVMYDEKTNCLHMNPGAAGKQGWHKTKTLIRFVVDGKEMKDCEIIELD